MDTKWKFEISAGDMYQMFAYARRYDTKKIFILSPVPERFYSSEEFSVQIFNVDLFDVEASIKKQRDLFNWHDR